MYNQKPSIPQARNRILRQQIESAMTANSDRQEPNTTTKESDIALSPGTDPAMPHFNRGIAWLRLSEWDKARADLTSASDGGLDVAAAFIKAYKSAGEFEEAMDIELPPDIADILDPISEEEDAALARATEEGLNSDKVEQLKAAAGGWVGLVDGEELKRVLYQARIDGSREPPVL